MSRKEDILPKSLKMVKQYFWKTYKRKKTTEINQKQHKKQHKKTKTKTGRSLWKNLEKFITRNFSIFEILENFSIQYDLLSIALIYLLFQSKYIYSFQFSNIFNKKHKYIFYIIKVNTFTFLSKIYLLKWKRIYIYLFIR